MFKLTFPLSGLFLSGLPFPFPFLLTFLCLILGFPQVYRAVWLLCLGSVIYVHVPSCLGLGGRGFFVIWLFIITTPCIRVILYWSRIWHNTKMVTDELAYTKRYMQLKPLGEIGEGVGIFLAKWSLSLCHQLQKGSEECHVVPIVL